MSDAAKPAVPGMMESTKEKVTVAATEAIATVQQHGKDGATSATKYANQAGDFIKSKTAPSTAAVEEKKTEVAATEGGGGVGDYINKAKGLFK